MLRTAKELNGYTLEARDGLIGTVKEFYFDDLSWTIRYLVANSGNWLTGRRVLISPYALDTVDTAGRFIPVDLTKDQIEHSPALETHKPISRQYELQYYPYYAWPTYWGGSSMWGDSMSPRGMRLNFAGNTGTLATTHHGENDDPHLRSTLDVSGHTIQAVDGSVGHIVDFVIDDETWAVRYFIIDTHNWLPGKKLLISTRWIDSISWEDSQVVVGLTCDQIKRSPEYTHESLITRDYEEKLHRHYNREGYWADELAHASSKR
jgi:hypothetical protein